MFRCYSLFSTSNTFNFCLKVFFEKNPFHFFNSKIYITPNLNIKFQKNISLNERGASDKTLESFFFFLDCDNKFKNKSRPDYTHNSKTETGKTRNCPRFSIRSGVYRTVK